MLVVAFTLFICQQNNVLPPYFAIEYNAPRWINARCPYTRVVSLLGVVAMVSWVCLGCSPSSFRRARLAVSGIRQSHGLNTDKKRIECIYPVFIRVQSVAKTLPGVSSLSFADLLLPFLSGSYVLVHLRWADGHLDRHRRLQLYVSLVALRVPRPRS